jgi:hypothetical protein
MRCAASATRIRWSGSPSLRLIKPEFASLDDAVIAASLEALRIATRVPPLVHEADYANAEKFDMEAGLLPPADRLGRYDGLYTNAFVTPK